MRQTLTCWTHYYSQVLLEMKSHSIVEPFFLPPAAFPLQSGGAAGLSLRPGPEPPAGSQLCQRRPAAQSCSDALAQLRWTPVPLKVPAGTQRRGKSCVVGEWCECKHTNKKGNFVLSCLYSDLLLLCGPNAKEFSSIPSFPVIFVFVSLSERETNRNLQEARKNSGVQTQQTRA